MRDREGKTKGLKKREKEIYIDRYICLAVSNKKVKYPENNILENYRS